MPARLGFEFSVKKRGILQRLPFFGKRVMGRILQEALDVADEAFKTRHRNNAAPGTGRLIKDPVVFKAVKTSKSIEKRVATFSIHVTGNKEVRGRVFLNEYGTRGAGGRLKPIRPKRARVLAIPNTRAGVSKSATPRQFPNAVWVPRGRDTQRPLLVELAPSKKPVGPNHKKPVEFMTPSRRIERVLFFGVPEVNIKPKGFMWNAFNHTIDRLIADFPDLIVQGFRKL